MFNVLFPQYEIVALPFVGNALISTHTIPKGWKIPYGGQVRVYTTRKDYNREEGNIAVKQARAEKGCYTLDVSCANVFIC